VAEIELAGKARWDRSDCCCEVERVALGTAEPVGYVPEMQK
jgi:hypothetical protein